MECSCDRCQAACIVKPGWMKPGEAEKIAEFLGISLEELFKTKLAIDWYDWDSWGEYDPDGSAHTFVLSPASTTIEPGKEWQGSPRGQCVFLVDGRCSIHPVKPHECAKWDHTMPADEGDELHKSVAVSWKGHYNKLVELLGEEPEAEHWDPWTWMPSLNDHLFGDYERTLP